LPRAKTTLVASISNLVFRGSSNNPLNVLGCSLCKFLESPARLSRWKAYSSLRLLFIALPARLYGRSTYLVALVDFFIRWEVTVGTLLTTQVLSAYTMCWHGSKVIRPRPALTFILPIEKKNKSCCYFC
jgi:hypothetical protein